MTTKTVPCQFFRKAGFCRNGNTCNYGHDLDVSVPAHSSRYDQSRKMQSQDFARFPQTCHFFREGRCMKGDKCPRRHEIPESSNPATDICRFFLTGKCTFGDKCRRSHTLDAAHTQINPAGENEATGAHTLSVKCSEKASATLVLAAGAVRDANLAGCKFEKVLVGATRAVYGDGAQIEDLFTGEQSRRFMIENLMQTCTADVVRSTVEKISGSVIDLKIIEGMETNSAIITMSTIHEAEKAIGFLKVSIPKAFEGRRRLSVFGIPETFESQKAQLSSTIEICCYYPSRLAWAHYSSEWDAKSNAKRLNGTLFDGRIITCRFQEPVYNYRGHRSRPTNFTVTVANLPESVTERHLLRRTKSNDVTINDPLYTTAQVKNHLAEVLRIYGTLVSWEMSPIRPGANKIYTFARYSSVQESRNALDGLSASSHPSIKFYVSLVKSMKYSVRNDLWHILEQHVQIVIKNNNDADKDRSSSVRLSLYDVDETTHTNRKFRIYGKDIKTLGKVKAAIDNLVRGEIFLHEGSVFWHELFETAGGTQLLNSLEVPDNVAVLPDMRTRTIRFYGEMEPRNAIKANIVDHIRALDAQQVIISLNRSELRYLLSGGLKTLQCTLGEERVRLNITDSTPELFLNKRDMVQALDLIRVESVPSLPAIPSQWKGCSICFCETEDPVDLECGHSCCRNCINHYLSSVLRSRSVPVNCITCAKPIPLAILRQFPEFDELLLASFKRYISLNPTTFENCPTADCPQVYRIGTSSETVVQCSECLAEICTSCKVIWHEGMTCAELRDSMNPDSIKNKQLMEQLGIHPCPRCSTNIEKIAGCNHMTCGGCQTHICWFCMRDFGLNNGSHVYDHMREAHGNSLYE